MFKWISHKKYPDYWNEYRKHFEGKKNSDIDTARFVIFDTETTGLHIKEDRILSIGAISIQKNTIEIAKSLETYIIQDKFDEQTVEIHGILKEGKITKLDEKQAIQQFLEYCEDAILVAHHAAFDIAMINQSLARLKLPKLKNKVLDTGLLYKKTSICEIKDKHYSLDELCEIFKIKKHDRHTALGDAYITGLIFLKIISNLSHNKKLTIKSLFYNPRKIGLLRI